MLTNFEASLGFVFTSEGGYSNVAADPGGPTQYGIIQREYNAFLRANGRPIQSVRNISRIEAQQIYKTKYWDHVAADRLPGGLDYAVFDFAVNSGPWQAVMKLQQVLNDKYKANLAVDGILGDVTLEAVANADIEELIEAYVSARFTFLKRLPTWRSFRLGWTHRLFGQPGDNGVLKNALSLVVHTPVSVN